MRIAIVNDLPMAMEGLRRLLLASKHHNIAWTAATGTEAVERCAQDVPDLILMDLIMPELDGVEATRAIMLATPCPILIVTASVDQNTAMVFDAMGSGALDAVNTPLLVGKNAADGRDALLRKIATIATLTRPITGEGMARESSLNQQLRHAVAPHLLTIGASSGGPQALAKVLSELPKDFPAAVVIVQHVDVQFVRGLARWLNEQSALPVRLAKEGDRPTAGVVLLAGTNEHLLLLADGALAYRTDSAGLSYRPSIDMFWRSLNRYWDGGVTAVLLTGMGRDGSQSMRELRCNGAHTIVQSQDGCAVFGMPKAAIEVGAAASVLPLENIAASIVGNYFQARHIVAVEKEPGASMPNENSTPKNQTINGNSQPVGNTTVVLLVDDQMMVAEGVRRMLAGEEDIQYHYCSDPKKAIAMAMEIKPTVILQDLIMPHINGYALVDEYRSRVETRNIPVIVLSTKEDPEDKSLAFERGANDYLVKLPSKIELIARIRAHSKSYIMQMQRDEAFSALREVQRELERSNEELQRLSCLDGLTGIANRRRFDEFMSNECLRSARESTTMSLLLIDIDYFKPYNDNYGHLAGDGCLRQVAAAMDEVVNRPADLVARYGGEEFGVVLPNTDTSGAVRVAKTLAEKIRSLKIPHAYSRVAGQVTVSMGMVSCVASDGTSPDDLIRLADEALYRAKESGRDGYKISEN